jgi:hypothetical protein
MVMDRMAVFGKKVASSSWTLPVLLVCCFVCVILVVYVFFVAPRQSPTWQQQMHIATEAARNVDQDAILFRIRATTPAGFPENQHFMPSFDFLTPTGQGFFVEIDSTQTIFFAKAGEPVQSTMPADLEELGSEWFREAATLIQVSPAEAISNAQTAIRDIYSDEVLVTPPLAFTQTGSEIMRKYSTRTVWRVVGGSEDQGDESSTTVRVTIDAETGEILDLEEFSD